jgi:AcrR family transcriptional regulator
MAGVPTSDLSAYARIRNAALAAFARDGVEASSIREIARAAGVSPGLVQHYFATKAALRDAVNEHVIALVAAPFEDVPLDPSGDDPFQALGDRITALVGAHPEAVRYAARAIVEGDDAALRLFDAFIAIAGTLWERLADAGLLREDLDREWTALHVVIFNLATVLFRPAIERHLPAPFLEPEQLQRWNVATTDLLREGAFRRR